MLVDKFEFAGIDYIVVDKFEYDGIEYMYIFEDISEKLYKSENIEAKADFVFKCEDGMYENVTDDDLYNKLMYIVSKNNTVGTNDIIEKYFK